MDTNVQTKPHRATRRERRAQVQEELFDLRRLGGQLLLAITSLVVGDEKEQDDAITTMLELIDTDIRIAKRMIRILDRNPRLKARAPALYERAVKTSMPGQLM